MRRSCRVNRAKWQRQVYNREINSRAFPTTPIRKANGQADNTNGSALSGEPGSVDWATL